MPIEVEEVEKVAKIPPRQVPRRDPALVEAERVEQARLDKAIWGWN